MLTNKHLLRELIHQYLTDPNSDQYLRMVDSAYRTTVRSIMESLDTSVTQDIEDIEQQFLRRLV